MSVAEDIAALEAALAKPQSQSADGVSETNQSLSELERAIRFKLSLQAQSAGRVGPTFHQIVPSGAVR